MNAQTLDNVIKAKILQNTLKLTDRSDAQALQEDAGINELQMGVDLAMIFKARQELEYVDFQEMDDFAGMSLVEVQHKFIMECVDQDTTLEELIEDSAAISYACLEDWASYYEYIVSNFGEMSEDVYKKLVSFLYDGYAVEETA